MVSNDIARTGNVDTSPTWEMTSRIEGDGASIAFGLPEQMTGNEREAVIRHMRAQPGVWDVVPNGSIRQLCVDKVVSLEEYAREKALSHRIIGTSDSSTETMSGVQDKLNRTIDRLAIKAGAALLHSLTLVVPPIDKD